MAVNLSPVGGVAGQFFDNNGNPLTGGKLYTYAAGTTTPQATYTSAAGVIAHSNPIILNAGGRVPNEIWLTDGLQYKFALYDANNVLIGTWDDIIGINSNFVNFVTAEEVQIATAGQTVFTLTTMQYQPGTNNLVVYVDGVNQVEGGSYSYVETNSTTVTFTAGLHVGAVVKFVSAETLSTGVTNASLVAYQPAGVGAVTTTVQTKLREFISVTDFGADPTGVADSVTAFNNAANAVATGGILYVPQGTYKLDSNVSILNKRVFAHGATFTGNGFLTAPLLETVSANVVRAGSYLSSGKAANTDGTGKGGFLIGGGTARSPNGVWMSLDGASNWLVAQTSKNENPTELIIYGSAAQGYATSVIGTGQITRDWGSEFQSSWIGNTIYFLRKKFKVSAVSSVNNLTVTELDGSPVVFPAAITEAYNYVYTSGSGLCNVNGTTITYVSGDPFVPLFFTDFKFTLNGVTTPLASFDSVTQYTAVSPPGNGTNVPFTWQGNINDQLTTFRVQAIQGVNEENVNLMSIAGDNFLGRYYTLNTGVAGTYGQYRPIFIGTGSYTDFSYQHQIGVYPRNYLGVSGQGYVALGGVQGREGVRVFAPNASTPLANRFETQAAASGLAPAWRARGSDTNVSFGIDMQGTGNLQVTQDFARTLLRVFGGSSVVNWFDITSSVSGTKPAIRATGSDADVSFGVDTKGIGEFHITQDFNRTLLKIQGAGSTVNWIEGRAAASGFAPTWGVTGSDTNIALDLSMKGNGEFRVTQDYARVLFKAIGSGSTVNWLNITASDSGNPTSIGVDPLSGDTNVDVLIATKGSGVVRFGTWTSDSDQPIDGYITIKDAAGNVRKIPTIA